MTSNLSGLPDEKRTRRLERAGFPPISPRKSIAQQALAAAFDTLWARIVPLLRPLVVRTVRALGPRPASAALPPAARRHRDTNSLSRRSLTPNPMPNNLALNTVPSALPLPSPALSSCTSTASLSASQALPPSSAGPAYSLSIPPLLLAGSGGPAPPYGSSRVGSEQQQQQQAAQQQQQVLTLNPTIVSASLGPNLGVNPNLAPASQRMLSNSIMLVPYGSAADKGSGLPPRPSGSFRPGPTRSQPPQPVAELKGALSYEQSRERRARTFSGTEGQPPPSVHATERDRDRGDREKDRERDKDKERVRVELPAVRGRACQQTPRSTHRSLASAPSTASGMFALNPNPGLAEPQPLGADRDRERDRERSREPSATLYGETQHGNKLPNLVHHRMPSL